MSLSDPPVSLGIATWAMVAEVAAFLTCALADGPVVPVAFTALIVSFVTIQIALGRAAGALGRSWFQYGVVSALGSILGQFIALFMLYQHFRTSSAAAQQAVPADVARPAGERRG